ncbi:MarR family winged helix-turn-helix transcriptional regulator [Aestuariispira insulae]|uniref:MarR family transcriptional regulator n=1 Tax=Aestuariispira insulae TaxID=1461337 RepID=A0A3D9HKA0_9PROT|nr:MarR family transcriptional regulator [Aestuariispira insulae]RED49894.1 MarR family transcriptional regulator [Aestuariispira insulae]
MPDKTEELHLENFLPYRLSILDNRVSQALSGIYQERFGLSIPEWRVMAILGRHAPLSSNQVADRGSMDKAKVSRAVARLLERDLISRETDPRDNRLLILKLSSKGRRIYAKISPLALGWEKALIGCLEPEEAEILDRIIDKLHRQVDQLG